MAQIKSATAIAIATSLATSDKNIFSGVHGAESCFIQGKDKFLQKTDLPA
ncbi:MAG: hypothetical protein GY895_05580 [Phycisphaera sp.]|nr:hypothetical protein [Phycisphaera sp.]